MERESLQSGMKEIGERKQEDAENFNIFTRFSSLPCENPLLPFTHIIIISYRERTDEMGGGRRNERDDRKWSGGAHTVWGVVEMDVAAAEVEDEEEKFARKTLSSRPPTRKTEKYHPIHSSLTMTSSQHHHHNFCAEAAERRAEEK